MADVQSITERLRTAVAAGPPLEARVRLDLKGAGVIHIEGGQVTNELRPADLVMTVSPADLVALGRRQLDPVRAMMSGRLRVSDMGLALSLQRRIQEFFAGTG